MPLRPAYLDTEGKEPPPPAPPPLPPPAPPAVNLHQHHAATLHEWTEGGQATWLIAWAVCSCLIFAAIGWRYLRRHLRVRARKGQWRKTGDMKRVGSSLEFVGGRAEASKDPHHFFDTSGTRKKDIDVEDENRTIRELVKEEREATRKVRENTSRVAVESFTDEASFDGIQQIRGVDSASQIPTKEDLRIMKKWRSDLTTVAAAAPAKPTAGKSSVLKSRKVVSDISMAQLPIAHRARQAGAVAGQAAPGRDGVFSLTKSKSTEVLPRSMELAKNCRRQSITADDTSMLHLNRQRNMLA